MGSEAGCEEGSGVFSGWDSGSEDGCEDDSGWDSGSELDSGCEVDSGSELASGSASSSSKSSTSKVELGFIFSPMVHETRKKEINRSIIVLSWKDRGIAMLLFFLKNCKEKDDDER